MQSCQNLPNPLPKMLSSVLIIKFNCMNMCLRVRCIEALWPSIHPPAVAAAVATE